MDNIKDDKIVQESIGNNAEEFQDKKSRKKKIEILLITLALLLVATIGFMLFLINNYNVRLVTINGKQQIMTGVTSAEFADVYDNLTVTFVDEGQSTSYTYNDLGIQIQWTDEQKSLFDNFAIDMDNMQLSFNYSEELQDIVQNLNNGRQDWSSATFVETENAFVLTKEQEGNKVDIELIEEYIISNLTLKDLIVNLDDFRYSQPEDFITATKYNQEALKWTSFRVTYSNGFTITPENIKPFFTLTDEHKIVFKQEMKEALTEQVWEWVNNDLQSYNTLGGTFKFVKHDGQEIELKGVNCGDTVDKQKEVEFLVEAIENLKIYTLRIPEMSVDYPDDIQSNVIEVSREDQHLWYWKNGKVHMETDIVTGWKDRWDTPTGVYQILNKIDGVYLVGADYRSWVDKWMRFWNGYGLHDAMWRSEFGGDIYTRNGSHGCINLPHSFAVELYDMVEPGDCIVIY